MSDWNHVDWDRVEAKALEEVLSLSVDIQLTSLGVLGEVKGGDLGNVLILALSLFFLKLEGDTTDWTTLNTFHQMGGVTSNLVAETLGGNDGNLIADSLVGLEVHGELGVVFLNNDLGGLLHSLRPNSSHFGGCK